LLEPVKINQVIVGKSWPPDAFKFFGRFPVPVFNMAIGK
jgi:hypothetical protein